MIEYCTMPSLRLQPNKISLPLKIDHRIVNLRLNNVISKDYNFVMNQYIDVKRIVENLYMEDQTKVVIEFPVYSEQFFIIESGQRAKISTFTYVFNIPKSHYVAFKGIETNISVSAESGIITPEKNGTLFITLMNMSLESRDIPRGIQLGSISIKKYSSFDDDT